MPPGPSPRRRDSSLIETLIACAITLMAGFATGATLAMSLESADASDRVTRPASRDQSAALEDAHSRRRARMRADRLTAAAALEVEAGQSPTRLSEQMRVDGIEPSAWLSQFGRVQVAARSGTDAAVD